MGLISNLDGARHSYRLCYVRAPWAFFTRIPVDQQWGERWEAAPYRAYAGHPYRDHPGQILQVAYDGPLLTPDQGVDGVMCSVLDINLGHAPWLRLDGAEGEPPLHIMAGATLESFVEAVELAGGHVFAPLGWGDLPGVSKSHAMAVDS
jgi:hypothetical protein